MHKVSTVTSWNRLHGNIIMTLLVVQTMTGYKFSTVMPVGSLLWLVQ